MPKTNPQSLAGLTAEEIKKWLTVEEYSAWHFAKYEQDKCPLPYSTIGLPLESLAACRASEDRKRKLLKKHEWILNLLSPLSKLRRCPECKRTKLEGHAPDCAIAAELAETGE